jgi:hypothetical protein
MNLAKKVVSVAAGVALVAGVGLAAAPAQAKINTKTSATIISFKKDLISGLEAQGIQISAVAPATWNSAKAEIRFPVTKVAADGISHSGGITFTKGGNPLTVTNPFIATPPGATQFDVLVYSAVLQSEIPLLVLKNPKPSTSCKVDGSHKKWIKKTTTRIQANVHLTSNQLVIDVLKGLSPAFAADLGMGMGRVTLVDDVNSKKKPKC